MCIAFLRDCLPIIAKAMKIANYVIHILNQLSDGKVTLEDWGLGGRVQGVELMGWVNTRPMVHATPYWMVSGGQEEPFSRLALAV